MKTFRITALSALLALGLSACQPPAADTPATASGASAANTDGSVSIAVNDAACEPMALTVPSGQTVFNIQNNSGRKLEWEILKGVMVVDERENIAPGLADKMTVTLLPGEYEMTCGLLTNPKGKLIVTGEATKDAAKADAVLSLGDAITAYKAYVTAETAQLVSGTKALGRIQSLCAGRSQRFSGQNHRIHRRRESWQYRQSQIAVCRHPLSL